MGQQRHNDAQEQAKNAKNTQKQSNMRQKCCFPTSG
jgi:hypothetical protein